MILEPLQKIKLYQLLYLIDVYLAECLKAKACPYCGAPLHVSNYFRKLRGGPDNLPEEFLIRHWDIGGEIYLISNLYIGGHEIYLISNFLN
ncbi:MAG: hypothetical protein HOD92_17610 [Deltaproteobacteria bacterium]|nr:hypothetical protein [Deltaproteobacteria bacterium]